MTGYFLVKPAEAVASAVPSGAPQL